VLSIATKEGVMIVRYLLPVIALGLAISFPGVASAQDFPATQPECLEAGGVWDDATASCQMAKEDAPEE
jgi:hypothetical protein